MSDNFSNHCKSVEAIQGYYFANQNNVFSLIYFFIFEKINMKMLAKGSLLKIVILARIE
jgi:hypothetical protein